jgi:hypothetical protein
MSGWLGVASAAHVRQGVKLGIAQIGHGRGPGLARMKAGDTLVYYSPVEHFGDALPLREFTALGLVADDLIWQADEGDFKPFRRRVDYAPARALPLEAVRSRLKLASAANWGYQLRRGLVPLDPSDVAVLSEMMVLR